MSYTVGTPVGNSESSYSGDQSKVQVSHTPTSGENRVIFAFAAQSANHQKDSGVINNIVYDRGGENISMTLVGRGWHNAGGSDNNGVHGGMYYLLEEDFPSGSGPFTVEAQFNEDRKANSIIVVQVDGLEQQAPEDTDVSYSDKIDLTSSNAPGFAIGMACNHDSASWNLATGETLLYNGNENNVMLQAAYEEHSTAGQEYLGSTITGDGVETNVLVGGVWEVVNEVIPTVTTQAASSVEESTATGNGNITDKGAPDPDARGFVFDTVSRSDPGDVLPGSSGYADYIEETGTFGSGAFTGSLTEVPDPL